MLSISQDAPPDKTKKGGINMAEEENKTEENQEENTEEKEEDKEETS